MGKFWLVWNEAGRLPARKHLTEQAARAEAERLAKANSDAFHVLEVVGTCSRVVVQWQGYDLPEPHPDFDDGDPFGDS